MATGKATESKMNDLHGLLCEILIKQVGETVIDEDGTEICIVSPAILSIAAKFLKDNEITCDVRNDNNMNNLQKLLSKKVRLSDASKAGANIDDE